MERRQHPDLATRYAMWEAYGRRCFYCRELVRFRDFELDHIIPQSIGEDDLSQILDAAGLAHDWNVKGLHNIVPACQPCNRQKHDRLSNPRQIILLTSEAKARLPLVATLAERYRREADADKVRALLEQALKGGALTWQEIEDVRPDSRPSGTLRLSRPVDFIDVAISELTASDVACLRDQPLRNAVIEMEFPEGTRRSITTIAQYDEARRDGGYPPTATDLRREGFFKNASAIFRAVALAQPPEHSFINRPRMGVCDIDFLPSSLLQFLGPPEEWQPLVERLPTIGEFARFGEATILTVGTSFVRVRPTRGLETSIWELLRADLDGDGFEDILVAVHGRAVGGSHGHTAEPAVLSRRDACDLFERSELKS